MNVRDSEDQQPRTHQVHSLKRILADMGHSASLSSPGLQAILDRAELAIAHLPQSPRNVADVPIKDMVGADGNLLDVYMAMSLLPDGVATLCGELGNGEVVVGQDFLDQAAAQEAQGRVVDLAVFYRFDLTQLRATSSERADPADATANQRERSSTC